MYSVIDLEFDADEYRRRFCDPLDKKNRLVMIQKLDQGGVPKIKYSPEGNLRKFPLNFDGIDVVVGHNFKGDMLYLWENPSFKAYLARGGKVWCTRLAEFLLEGQNKDLRYGLQDLDTKYGGEGKIDVVGEHLKAGKKFSELDRDIAIKYGAQDVLCTENVYLNQLERIKAEGMLPVIEAHMERYLCITEMEYNGLHVDVDIVSELQKKEEANVEKYDITSLAIEAGWPEDKVNFNTNSIYHMSVLFFGGEIPYIGEVPNPLPNGQDRYQSGVNKGKLRTKKAKLMTHFKGMGIKAKKECMLKKEGYYSTSDGDMEEFKHHEAVGRLFKWRGAMKLLNTYYIPYQECINPYTGAVHTEFQPCGTASGRLSSRNPNVQNIKPALLEAVKPRHEGWALVEADYSSIEVVVAAWLFKEDLLLQELRAGLDPHEENAKSLLNKDKVTTKERKLAKAMTFGILYGQGAYGMAARFGLDLHTAEKFISLFYNKYTAIAEGHNAISGKLLRNRYNDEGRTYSFLRSITGRKYTFKEMFSRGSWGFSPTMPKNYPCQGTACDFHAIAEGELYRTVAPHRDKILLINDIHDAVLAEVDMKYLDMYKDMLYNTMGRAHKLLGNKLGISIDIPLSIDVNYGYTWAECK